MAEGGVSTEEEEPVLFSTKPEGRPLDGVADENISAVDADEFNFIREIIPIGRLAFPVVVTLIAQFSMALTTVLFMGHLGPEQLAGYALGNLFVNVTGFSVAIGIMSGMDTLCTQAYGAGNYPRVGIVTQRGFLCVSALLLPVCVIWFYSEQVLLLLWQEPPLAALAGYYTRWFIPNIFLAVLFEAMKKFLQVQGVVRPTLYVSLVCNVLHVGYCYCFIHVLSMGFKGAPAAYCASTLSQLALTFTYIVVMKPHVPGTWPGIGISALQGWGEFLRLGLPGAVMLTVEWWNFELMALSAGTMGTIPLATHSVLATLAPFLYMVPLGLGVAGSTRIGNLLGAGNAPVSRRAAWICIGLTLAASVTVAALLMLGGKFIPLMFSSDPAVVAGVSSLMFVFALFHIFDAVQGVSQAILRGAGKQAIGAGIAVGGCYLISLPSAFFLAFVTKLGVAGLWIGMTFGYGVMGVLFLIFIRRLDWGSAMLQAQTRSLVTPSATEEGFAPQVTGCDEDDADAMEKQNGDVAVPKGYNAVRKTSGLE